MSLSLVNGDKYNYFGDFTANSFFGCCLFVLKNIFVNQSMIMVIYYFLSSAYHLITLIKRCLHKKFPLNFICFKNKDFSIAYFFCKENFKRFFLFKIMYKNK